MGLVVSPIPAVCEVKCQRPYYSARWHSEVGHAVGGNTKYPQESTDASFTCVSGMSRRTIHFIHFGLLLLGTADPGFSHFKQNCLVRRIERGLHQAQAFSCLLLTFFRC